MKYLAILFSCLILVACNKAPEEKPKQNNVKVKQDFETIECLVSEVVDGDTIKCVDDKKNTHVVDLAYIDAPELDQPYGKDSKEVLVNDILGEEIPLTIIQKNQNGTILGQIFYNKSCPKSTSQVQVQCELDVQSFFVEYRLLRAGCAWYVPSSASFDKTFIALEWFQEAEQKAREAKRGLWADPNPIPPWEWRKQKKHKK